VALDEPPLSPIQMLWVNLIMDTFASLALATEAPTDRLLDRAPYGRTESIITRKMWRFVIGSALMQLAVVFFLLYAAQRLPWLGLPRGAGEWDAHAQRVRATVVFNTFVWLQLFNLFHARKLEDGTPSQSVRDRSLTAHQS
jgi:magnesium-transporting ATPase (P-type)